MERLTDSLLNQKENKINQPLSVDWRSKEGPTVKERDLPMNLGDVIAGKTQSVEEKAKQVAVDSPDITGDWIRVLTLL